MNRRDVIRRALGALAALPLVRHLKLERRWKPGRVPDVTWTDEELPFMEDEVAAWQRIWREKHARFFNDQVERIGRRLDESP